MKKEYLVRFPKENLDDMLRKLGGLSFVEPSPENRIEFDKEYIIKVEYIGKKTYEEAAGSLRQNDISYEPNCKFYANKK